AVPDGPWKGNAIGRSRFKQHGVTWGADHVAARRLVFREDAADGKHYGIGCLSLDIAACLRRRPRLERADLQPLTGEQCLANDFHHFFYPNPALSQANRPSGIKHGEPCDGNAVRVPGAESWMAARARIPRE